MDDEWVAFCHGAEIAFRPRSGRKRRTSLPLPDGFYATHMAFGEDTFVLVGAGAHRVLASGVDGSARWTAPARFPVHVAVANGMAIVFAETEIVALDLESGEQRWSTPQRGRRSVSTTLHPDGSLLFATGVHLGRLDVESGALTCGRSPGSR